MIERLFSGLLSQIHRRPRAVVGLLVVLTMVATSLWPRFRIEADVSQLLPEGNEVVRLSRLVEKEVASARDLMIMVRNKDVAERLPDIVASLRKSPHIAKVDGTIEDFVGAQAERVDKAPLYFLPERTRAKLLKRMTDPKERAKAIADARAELAANPVTGKQVLLQDPLGLRWLAKSSLRGALPFKLESSTDYVVFAGGERGLVRITGKQSPSDFDYTAQLMNDLRTRLSSVDHQMVGMYASTELDAQRIDEDLKRSTLLTVLLVGLFLLVSMRRLSLAALVLFPIGLAVYWALPLGGAILGPLTLITIGAAAILVGLGVDFTIHFLVCYVGARRELDHGAALASTMKQVGRPLLASMVTTVAAFSVLGFAHFHGLRLLGALLAGGLTLALVSTFLTLPLLLKWYRPPSHGSEGPSPATSHATAQNVFDRFAASRPGRVFALLLLLVVMGGAGLTAHYGVSFSGDLGYLRPSGDKQALTERAFEKEFGFFTIPAVILVPKAQGLDSLKASMAKLQAEGALAWSTGPHLAHVSTEDREAVSRFRRASRGWVEATLEQLDEAGFNPEPFRPGLQAIDKRFSAGVPKGEDPAFVRLGDTEFAMVLCYPKREWLTQKDWGAFVSKVHEVVGPKTRAYHTLTLLDEIHSVIWADMRRMVYLAAAFIALALGLLVGGWRSALMASVPAVGGLSITLGAMAVFSIPLNMGNCICIPFLLGMGVDGGVHAMHRIRQSGGLELGDCATAIWRTSATSLLAFIALSTAQTPVISSIGTVGAIGVAASFLCCILLVPVLLTLLPEQYRR